jgi:hypothetical protein
MLESDCLEAASLAHLAHKSRGWQLRGSEVPVALRKNELQRKSAAGMGLSRGQSTSMVGFPS